MILITALAVLSMAFLVAAFLIEEAERRLRTTHECPPGDTCRGR